MEDMFSTKDEQSQPPTHPKSASTQTPNTTHSSSSSNSSPSLWSLLRAKKKQARRPHNRPPMIHTYLLKLGWCGGHRRRKVLHDHPSSVVRLLRVISSEREAEARPHLHGDPVDPPPRQRVVALQRCEVAVHAHRSRGVFCDSQLRQPSEVFLYSERNHREREREGERLMRTCLEPRAYSSGGERRCGMSRVRKGQTHRVLATIHDSFRFVNSACNKLRGRRGNYNRTYVRTEVHRPLQATNTQATNTRATLRGCSSTHRRGTHGENKYQSHRRLVRIWYTVLEPEAATLATAGEKQTFILVGSVSMAVKNHRP